jgi:hypothetical protein
MRHKSNQTPQLRTLAVVAMTVVLVVSAGATGVALAASTSVAITPADPTVESGSTTTVDVVATAANDGVSSYQFDVVVDDPSVASITNVEVPDSASSDNVDVSIASDGSSAGVQVFGVDLGNGEVVLATVTLEGATAGSSTGLSIPESSVAIGDAASSPAANYDIAGTSGATLSVADSSTGEMTVAEAVASYGSGDDSTISNSEIQQAINWWSTDSEVPGTDGQTIDNAQIQQLINAWSTGATVGDGGGDQQAAMEITSTSVDGNSVTVQWDGTAAADNDHVHVQLDDEPYVGGQPIDGSYTFEDVAPGEHTVSVTVADMSHTEYDGASDSATVTVADTATGSALVEITPESGNVDASTYGGGTYQVTNTGDKEITSVSFNLDTATLPDMVFDPQGTAGDPTGEGLNIVSEGGTGITTAGGGSEAFSQPHNGQNADDGYDVMTVEFDDFQSGETATFWADNDPTSIKGATVGSQEAGPVSGLELARSTVTVTYADGTTQTTQLMGDGSNGGATAVVTADEAPAPTIGAQGVSLDSSVLDGYHSGATVSEASQTITVTGEPGETVTLVRVEGELALSNVPDADGSGEPGYQLEELEANNAVAVEYYSVTLDSNGEATVPVTLTDSPDDDDAAGFNYFVAAHGEASGDMGLASNVVVLEYDESAGGDNTAPTVDSITDVGVSQGESTTVDVTASDDDSGDTPSLSVSTGPGWVSLSDAGDGTGTLTIAPSTDVSVGTYTVEVTANDGDGGTATEEFAVYVDEPNQDGETVFAVNAGGSEYTATDGTTYQADTNFDTGSTYGTTQAIDGTDDDTLYQTERYGGSFGYDIPVSESGTYEVTLQFAEIFQGVSGNDAPDSTTPPTDGTNENDRLFDASIEGQQVLSEYDIFSEVGPLTATEKTYTVEVTDGTLNVDFSVVNDNAKISAIEVEQVGDSGGNSAPTIDAITDQTVTEGDSATVPVTADDPDGDSVTLSVSGPDFVSLSNGELSITPETGDAADSPYTVEVTADDGNGGTATEAFQLTVEAAASGADLVYAVNAGGPAYTATDGTEYVADTNFAGSFSGAGTSDTSLGIANTEDDPLYQTERYGDPLTYSMPVDDGTYEVTLQFAEIYHTSQTAGAGDDAGAAGEVGDRLFDVSIEGQQVLSDYDIYDEVGGLTATEQTFTVEVTDGTLNIAMPASVDNAKLSAFTVESVSDDGGSGATGSADIAVTPDSSLGASTFSGGSFEVTNTGDKQISSITFDVSESLVPDAVFDPDGTAGDATAKQLSIDSQSGDGVGVVSTADGDVFSQPHNGQDNGEGYDVMSIDFDDFESGESVGFSIDLDPTTIKGVSTTGGAGSVSGLEIAASSVTVEYADGSTQTTDLASDGSDGGAQATAKGDVPAAPTLGVQDVSLQGTDFPGHQAATVDATGQTLTISGPADATVQLTHVVGSELGSNAYDADDYEIDSAESVDTQTVTLDSNGEATVGVSLSESNLDYFVVAVEDGSGDTGETSDVVILDYEESTGSTAQVLHRVNAGEDTTVSATDDGPDWTGVADTSSEYLASVASSDAGNYCGGTIESTTSNVPSSTPDGVWDCERFGESTWEFSVDSGQTVEVRLYVGNSFSGTSSVGDRQFNAFIEGNQVLTNYDPVADVGHATGTMKSFTVTDDGDGTITVTLEQGNAENPEVRGIEIVETEDSE